MSIGKDEHGGVESASVRQLGLRDLLVEATRAVNETDALAVAHDYALELLKESGLSTSNSTKHLYASVVSEFDTLAWVVGSSKLHVSVSLRTVRADDPGLKAWKPVELADAIDKRYVQILLRAFHAKWKELGWDYQIQVNWLWEKEYAEPSVSLFETGGPIMYKKQCLRVCVFRGVVAPGGPETYSFLTFDGPDGEPI